MRVYQSLLKFGLPTIFEFLRFVRKRLISLAYEIPIPDKYIDPEQMIFTKSQEEIDELAERYFSSLRELESLYAKPFVSTGETPGILANVSGILSSANLFPGARVLDFAAGSCWFSKILVQMGCDVVASDVSGTALKIGKQLFDRQPPVGPTVGNIRFELSQKVLGQKNFEEFFDRILIFDAFHHLTNFQLALNSFHKLLRPGGILVMSEPGRWHSRTSAAQDEMRKFGVLERDFDVEAIGELAKASNFCEIEVGLYSPVPWFVPFASARDVLARDFLSLSMQFNNYSANHSLLRMKKSGIERLDSRSKSGLVHNFELSEDGVKLSIRNDGIGSWLPGGTAVGSVNVGISPVLEDGRIEELGRWKFPLSTQVVGPGDSTTFFIPWEEIDSGCSVIEIDLLAERVAWFGRLGSRVIRCERPSK